MRKRLFTVLLISAMAGTFTGCAGNIAMTEKQTDLAAEYISSIILKYNQKDNSNKLVKLDETEADAGEALSPVESEQPSATQLPVQETEETKNSAVTKPVTDKQQENANSDRNMTTLESLYGLKDVSITYNSVKEYKTYPKGSEAITANDNHKFLVVSFQLANHSDKEVRVDLLKSNVSFSLSTSGDEMISGAHTLLSNDMTYYQGMIKSNKSKEVVVLFEVEESFQLSNATFYAFADNKKACEVTIK